MTLVAELLDPRRAADEQVETFNRAQTNQLNVTLRRVFDTPSCRRHIVVTYCRDVTVCNVATTFSPAVLRTYRQSPKHVGLCYKEHGS